MLWDADALNLLAINPDKRHNRVITPHPGKPRGYWVVLSQKLKVIAYFQHVVW